MEEENENILYLECQQSRESRVDRGSVHRQLRQPELPPAHHDEGPVRQLRGPEDDRRGGDQPAEDLDAQDTASHLNTEKIHLWQAYSG